MKSCLNTGKDLRKKDKSTLDNVLKDGAYALSAMVGVMGICGIASGSLSYLVSNALLESTKETQELAENIGLVGIYAGCLVGGVIDLVYTAYNRKWYYHKFMIL